MGSGDETDVRQRVWTRERARRQGVARERLTGGVEFVRVVPGHYLEACWADDLASRCAAVQVAEPRGALSHWTALALHALPTPAAGDGPIHLTVPAAVSPPKWSGVVGHRADRLPTYSVDGLVVSGAVRSWCDAAALVAGPGSGRHDTRVRDRSRPDRVDLADLVAAGDVLAARRPTTLRDIRIVLGTRPGGRGAGVARTAAELLDARAESPQESRLRVVVALAGLAPPAVQHEVRTPSGTFVARVDLAWPGARLAVEYDGDHHRDRQQWRKDLARRERLDALGWRVVVVTAADLRADPAGVVARVGAALAGRTSDGVRDGS